MFGFRGLCSGVVVGDSAGLFSFDAEPSSSSSTDSVAMLVVRGVGADWELASRCGNFFITILEELEGLLFMIGL